MSCQVLNDSEVTARKRHKCIWCGDWIEAGEKYYQQSGIFDGEPFRNRYHSGCHAGMLELHRIDGYAIEDGFSPYSFKRGTAEER